MDYTFLPSNIICSELSIDVIFICLPKKNIKNIKEIFSKFNVSISNVSCSCYSKSISYKNNFVSWALEKNYWGKIKFSEHLKEATRDKKLKYSCIIIKENIKSQIAALKAGFKLNKIKDRKIFLKK